jgi:hypothetical protein
MEQFAKREAPCFVLCTKYLVIIINSRMSGLAGLETLAWEEYYVENYEILNTNLMT